VEGCALNCAKADEELVFDAPAGTVMQAETVESAWTHRFSNAPGIICWVLLVFR
jgi:hypothetical protein